MSRPLIPPHKVHKAVTDYDRKQAKAVPWEEVEEVMEDRTRMIDGNLVDMAYRGKFDVIIHGCNCFCTMGAGIAKEIAHRFPPALAVDLQTIRGDRSKLGSYTSTVVKNKHGGNLIIVNLYTQYRYGRDRCHFDYDAFRRGLKSLAPNAGDLHIGMPMIGAGLAGGDWDRIKQILEEEFANVNYTVVRYHGRGRW